MEESKVDDWSKLELTWVEPEFSWEEGSGLIPKKKFFLIEDNFLTFVVAICDSEQY